jgi:mRNA-degrading endonuclease toxin of MazEF toxin-antitoxin module
VSIAKSELTNYVGSLSDRKLAELSAALKVAFAIEE